MAKEAQSPIGSPYTYTPHHLAQKILNSRAALEGERKLVTVLFADLKGSMELLGNRDPEEARRLLDPVLEHMMEAVHYYEGTVNQAAGDGIMALFGAPLAHEDHAVRACLAALRMQERVKEHSKDVFHGHGVNVQIRVGLNSGEVVVGTIRSDLRMDYTAVGRTTHLAARMEQMATPGSVLLTPFTLGLVEEVVTVKSLGPVLVKGLDDPLEVYELTGMGSARIPFRAVARQGLTEFIGRDAEFAVLESALRRAARGDGCVVGFEAEAGVGKSRLCFEFANRCRALGVRVAQGRAQAHHCNTPYALTSEVTRTYFQISSGDSLEQARGKVVALLQRIAPDLAAEISLLTDFLGLSEPDVELPLLDPTIRRNRLIALFRRLIRAAGTARSHQPQPGLILIEDLQWVDAASASLIDVLIEAVRGSRLLVIVNYRPGYAASWMKSNLYEQASLQPLGTQAADALAVQLLGKDEAVARLLPLIADRACGNPLFIEELVRQFEESGCIVGKRGAYHLKRAPDMRAVPGSVLAIIAARIDRRSDTEKSLLQAAAVIGRAFSVTLLAGVLGRQSSELTTAIRSLSLAGLIRESSNGESAYAFNHPMMQEVAYRTLLSERRRSLHAAVATELQTLSSNLTGAEASLIAHHWEEAGEPLHAACHQMKAAAWFGSRNLEDSRTWDRVRDPGPALHAYKRAHILLSGQTLDDKLRSVLVEAAAHVVNLGEREKLPATELESYYTEVVKTAPRSMSDKRRLMLVSGSYGRALASSGSANDFVAVANKTLSKFQLPGDAGLFTLVTAVRCYAHRLAGNLRAALADNDYAVAHAHEIDGQDQQPAGFDSTNYIKVSRGQILMQMARYDEAKKLLEEVIAGDSESVSLSRRFLAHGALVEVAYGLRNLELAI